VVVNVSNALPTDVIQCKLDGQAKGQFCGPETFTLNLIGLSEGAHQLEIHIYYHGLGQTGAALGGNTILITQPMPMEKLRLVSFTVESSLPSPSPSAEPSPSITPSPSPNPTSTPTLAPTIEPTIVQSTSPQQSIGFLGTNLPVEYGYALVAVLVIIVVAGLSLVYHKKLRKK
jgi:hypothetical protein